MGDDLAREKPSRLTGFTDRSNVDGVPREPLPGIAPLDTRIGWILQDPSAAKSWGIEMSARMVGRQTRVAATLQELETAGFATG